MAEHTEEEFRMVPGFDAYRVSNLGRFQSRYKRGVHHEPLGEWRDVKGGTHKKGYRLVSLVIEKGVIERRLLHPIILEVFVGPRPCGMVARHLDGNNKNNRLDNLAWGTQAENCKDTVLHGRSTRGEKNPMSRLTEDQVREIRKLHASGMRNCDIARAMNMDARLTHRIANGHRWGWVDANSSGGDVTVAVSYAVTTAL